MWKKTNVHDGILTEMDNHVEFIIIIMPSNNHFYTVYSKNSTELFLPLLSTLIREITL